MRKDLIYKQVQSKNHEYVHGIYLTCYDKNATIIISKGVAETDKSIEKTIDILYHGLIKPIEAKISYIQCDIVVSLEEISNENEINVVTEGLLIVDRLNNKSASRIPTGDENHKKKPLETIIQKHGLQQHDKLYKMILQTSTIHP